MKAVLVLVTAGVVSLLVVSDLSAQMLRAPVRDSTHKFQKRIWSWKEFKQRNIVMQQRDYSCGAAALATVMRYYWGDPVTEQQILLILDKILTPEQKRDRQANGLTLTDLRQAAIKAGYQATIGRLPFAKLPESKVPLVIGITVDGFDHFVVFRGFDGEWVYLADPIRGNIRVEGGKFVQQWQKNLVLVVAKPGAKVKDHSPLSLHQGDVNLGWLNWQLIRTFPERVVNPQR